MPAGTASFDLFRPPWVSPVQHRHAQETSPVVLRGPYLQLGTPTSVIIRWRTDQAVTSRVLYGNSPTALSSSVATNTTTTEHQIALTGLSPDTRYYYAIGTSTGILSGGDLDHFFVTAPLVGTSKAVRMWVLGDFGRPGPSVRQVRDSTMRTPVRVTLTSG